MKYLLLLSATLFGVGGSLLAQCDLNTSASSLTITCGQSVTLSAYGSSTGQVVLDENFNSGGFGPGWGATPGATNFNNPCSAGGVDGTPHAWMGSSTSVPRTLTSAPYDLSTATFGVSVCFDLLFARQSQPAPCEGPDEPDEGVYLQYSINGGATWIDIHYFDPNGGYDPQLTNWNNWCFELPAAAITSNTLIRWHQIADSGPGYDHWGIDNVQIFQNDIHSEVIWLHDGYSYGVGNPGGENPNVVTPTTTTTYTSQITTGTGQVCTSTVTVTVLPPVYEVNVAANPSTLCVGECATISGTGHVVVDPGGPTTFENNQPQDVSAIIGNIEATVNINVQGLNMTSLTSGSIAQICIDQFSYFSLFPSYDVADFSFKLVAPNGCGEIILIPHGGLQNPPLFNSNLTNVCFSVSGGTNLGTVSAPYSGNYQPNQPFSTLNGCDPNGVWQLVVSAPATFNFGSGTFDGWSITFNDVPEYGTANYSWSPTTGLSDPTSITTQACPTSTTNYVLTVDNGTPGCATHTENVNIIVDPCGGCIPPAVNVNPINGCASGTISLASAIVSGSAPATTSYYATQADAQSPASPISSTVTSSGVYWMRYEDPNDPTCFGVTPIYVTVNPADNAAFTLTDFCPGSSNQATGVASPGGTFSFNPAPSDGATINALSGAIANSTDGTTYTVQYTTTGNCPSTLTHTVTAAGFSYTASIVDETCGDGNGSISLTPSGGASPYHYILDAGIAQTTGSFTGLGAGTYPVLIVDNNGCQSSGTENIANSGAPVIDSLPALNPTCGGGCDGSITAAVSGGTPPYTYAWFDAANNPVGTNSPTLSNLCGGTYTLEVTDATSSSGGCPATDSAILINPDGNDDPSFTVSNYCEGNANSATGIVTSGGTFTFNPVPTDGASIHASTGAITNGIGGTTYTIQYTVPGMCANSQTHTVTVNALPNPVISGNLTYCAGGNTTLSAGGPYASYLWSTGSINQTITATAQNGISVTVIDNNGCQGTSQAVNVTSVAQIVNNSTVTVCQGQSATIHGNQQTTAGVYSQSFPSSGGCDSISNVTLVVNPAPIPVIAGNLWYCEGNQATLDAGGPYASYSWSTGGTQQTIQTTTSSPITVTVTDVNGCTGTSAPVTLTPPPVAAVSATPSTGIAPLEVDLTNSSQNASGYYWNFGNGSGLTTTNTDGQNQIYDSIGQHTVLLIATSQNGCSDTAYVTIVVIEPAQPMVIEFPNIFTPNGDHNNDFFEFASMNVASLEVVVTNRWGNLMFKSSEVNFQWDGTMPNGNPASEGVYFYQYKVTGQSGEQLEGQKFVHLMK